MLYMLFYKCFTLCVDMYVCTYTYNKSYRCLTYKRKWENYDRKLLLYTSTTMYTYLLSLNLHILYILVRAMYRRKVYLIQFSL